MIYSGSEQDSDSKSYEEKASSDRRGLQLDRKKTNGGASSAGVFEPFKSDLVNKGFFNQNRVGDCGNSGIANQDDLGTFYFDCFKFVLSIFYKEITRQFNLKQDGPGLVG